MSSDVTLQVQRDSANYLDLFLCKTESYSTINRGIATSAYYEDILH